MQLLSLFTDIVEQDEIITDQQKIATYCTDQRGRYFQAVSLVLQPKTVARLQQIMRICYQHKIAITPQGGNTGLCGGATPTSADGIILSLSKLNRLRSVNLIDNCMTVEAGMTLQHVQDLALEQGRFFPLNMASKGSCQIGGNVACNAGGLNVLRYGTARDLVMGLEVVLADGSLVSHLPALHKNTTGFDTKHLFIGSEGIYGVITAVNVKLFALPQYKQTLWIGCASIEETIKLLTLTKNVLPLALSSFELISSQALQLSQQYSDIHIQLPPTPWHVLMEFTATADFTVQFEEFAQLLVEQQFNEVLLTQSDTQTEQIWRLRENISAAQKSKGVSIKHDIALPIAHIAEFLHNCEQALLQQFASAEIYVFGHLGDGSLHYNVFLADCFGQDIYQYEEQINHCVYQQVLKLSGTIAAEHGIGQLKRQYLPLLRDKQELALMRKIKQQLDPQNLLNANKVLPD